LNGDKRKEGKIAFVCPFSFISCRVVYQQIDIKAIEG
jgi:hypothetical protein